MTGIVIVNIAIAGATLPIQTVFIVVLVVFNRARAVGAGAAVIGPGTVARRAAVGAVVRRKAAIDANRGQAVEEDVPRVISIG